MKKIKMIGLDLDGTLLNDKKELTSHTRKILTRAIDQGVTVLVATGRPVTGIPEVLRNFPGMRYALTSNGGRILDLQEDKVLYANMLSYEMGAAILKIFGDYDTFKEIYFDGRGFVQADELLKVGEYLRNPAMANGADEVKEVADYITLSNEEDGVAAAIEKFVLNPERG